MNYPKISIVTPNFNQVHFIEDTIKSVLNQGYPNLEYIIIDGGSTDGSIDIIKKYESQLTYWISEPDEGMYEAIQKGFNRSTGEIMAWLNSDDMYHSRSLFVVASIFNSFPVVKWLTGMNTFFDENGFCIQSASPTKINKYDYYQKKIEWIQQESTFWRRELWNQAGGFIDTKLKYAGDFELWLRFFRTDRLFFTTALLGGFRLRSSNQLSLDMLSQYYEEAYNCIDDEVLSDFDSKLILKKKRNNNLFLFLSKFKIFPRKILNKIIFKPTIEISSINFDRTNQTFYISSKYQQIF